MLRGMVLMMTCCDDDGVGDEEEVGQAGMMCAVDHHVCFDHDLC